MIVYDGATRRTMDTETGIYLTSTNGTSREQYWGFTVVDGDTRIAAKAEKTAARIGDRKYLVEYDVESPPVLLGRPKRSGYAALIEALIEAHSDFHGDGTGFRGEVVAQVTFSSRFLDRLASWEEIHGVRWAGAVA